MRGRIEYDRQGNPTYFIGDRPVTAEEFKKAFPPKGTAIGSEVATTGTTTWPLVSEALAVHPEQVAEANARSKRHNLGVEYDRQGFAHIPDRAARRRLLKLEGYVDRSGGYGDG